MITISNSNELNDVLKSTSLEPIQLPINANVLIGSEQPTAIIEKLEIAGRNSRRSVHLRQFRCTR